MGLQFLATDPAVVWDRVLFDGRVSVQFHNYGDLPIRYRLRLKQWDGPTHCRSGEPDADGYRNGHTYTYGDRDIYAYCDGYRYGNTHRDCHRHIHANCDRHSYCYRYRYADRDPFSASQSFHPNASRDRR